MPTIRFKGGEPGFPPPPPPRQSQKDEDPKTGVEGVQENVSPRDAMLEAEAAYFEEYKTHVSSRKKDSDLSEKLIALKDTYNKSRIEYRKDLNSKARKAILNNDERAKRVKELDAFKNKLSDEERQRRLEIIKNRYKDLSPEERDKRIWETVARYNRLVTYSETIKQPAERKLQARFEVLDARKKNIFHQGLIHIGKLNGKLDAKYGTTKARAIRAIGGAAVIGGVAAGAGAFATAGVLGALGWGAFRAGRAFIASVAGAAVGETVARVIDSEVQKDSIDQERWLRGYADGDNLDEIDTKQESITSKTNERTRAKRRMIARTLTSIGVGAGLSGLLSALPSVEAAADVDSGTEDVKGASEDLTPAEQKGKLGDVVSEVEQVKKPDVPKDTAGTATETSPQEPSSAAEAPKVYAEGKLEAGDGANELLYELRAGLVAQYGEDLEGAPDHVKHFVNDQSMLERSQQFGFMTDEGSVLVHPGASLSFNEQGELVMQDPEGVGTVKLMDAEGKTIDSEITKIKEFEHLPDTSATASGEVGTKTEQESIPSEQPGVVEASQAQNTQDEAQVSTPPSTVAESTASSVISVEGDAVPAAAPEAVPSNPGPMTLGSLMDAEAAGLSEEAVPYSAPIEQGNVPSTLGEIEDSTSVPESAGEETPAAQDSIIPEANEVKSPMTLESLSATIQPIEGSPQIAYISAENPTVAQSLATTYAQQHPGTKIVFDNPKHGLFSFFDRPRVSSVVLNPENGKLVFTEQEVDAQGKPLIAVEPSVLGKPTNLA